MDVLVDYAIFVDGPYKDFPHAIINSPNDQYDAIIDSCEAAGIPLHIHRNVSGEAWASQIHKRTVMFKLAAMIGTVHEDYAFVIDADEYIAEADHHAIREQLRIHTPDVATVRINTPTSKAYNPRIKGTQPPHNSYDLHGKPNPRIFRLLPEIIVGPIHHGTYAGVDENGRHLALRDRGTYLRQHGFEDPEVIDLAGHLSIINDTWKRDPERLKAKHEYGITREQKGIDL